MKRAPKFQCMGIIASTLTAISCWVAPALSLVQTSAAQASIAAENQRREQKQTQIETHQAPWQRQHGHRDERLKRFELTEAQTIAIEKVRTEARRQMEAVLSADQLVTLENTEFEGRPAWRELELSRTQRSQIHAIHEERKAKVDAMLTAEQRQHVAERHEAWETYHNELQSQDHDERQRL